MNYEYKKNSKDVFYIDGTLINISEVGIEILKKKVLESKQKRSRLCVHTNTDDLVHEMFIVLLKDSYIMPAKHKNKDESMHVIEGRADAVFFNEKGDITSIVKLGDYNTGLDFFYRMRDSIYHTIIVRSEYFIFHEVGQGPLNRSETILAPWAPDQNDLEKSSEFLERLKNKVDRIS